MMVMCLSFFYKLDGNMEGRKYEKSFWVLFKERITSWRGALGSSLGSWNGRISCFKYGSHVVFDLVLGE